jgi:hypothetical protein
MVIEICIKYLGGWFVFYVTDICRLRRGDFSVAYGIKYLAPNATPVV